MLRPHRFAAASLAAWLFIGAAVAFADGPAASSESAFRGPRFIRNGQIQLGVDLDRGGAITYLAPRSDPPGEDTASQNPKEDDPQNIVNNWDYGRQIQLSFYSGPIPFVVGDKRPAPEWAGLGWNPIQAGDCHRNGSRTLDYQSDGRSLYVKCAPLQWPLENTPAECTFETWIKLDGPTAHLRGKLHNARSDRRQYAARLQELPAIYTGGAYHRLMTYRGAKPFAGEPLEQIIKPASDPAPWVQWQATEHWAALARDDNWGLGVWAPGCQLFSGGFAGAPGSGGSRDNPTGYMTPNHMEILDHDIDYEFECVLILGSLEDIRRYAVEHDRRAPAPRFRFARDRQHWHWVNAADQGLPLRDAWRVQLEKGDPQLIAPPGLWQAADARKLVIEAAYDAPQRDSRERLAQIFWRRWDAPSFSDKASKSLSFTADGEMHRYELDLSTSPEYTGAIIGLRIDPTPQGAPGESITVREIRFEP